MLFITYGARAQETKESVTVNDVDRNYMVRLPRGYDHEKKYPVVILLHGMNQETDDMERLTRFDCRYSFLSTLAHFLPSSGH